MSKKKQVRTVKTESYEAPLEDETTEIDISELIDQETGPSEFIFDSDDYAKAKVHRIGPPRIDGKAVPQGFMGWLEGEDIDEGLIQSMFGGGKYRVTAFNERSKYAGSKVIDIVGEPIEFDKSVAEGPRSVSDNDSTLRIELLKDELSRLREEIRGGEAKKPSALESLLENPSGLAAIITAIAPFFSAKEDPRIAAVERQLERLIDKASDKDTPDFMHILKYMQPFQEGMLDMQSKLMDARIESLINSSTSESWIGFAREMFHGPWGEKLMETADSLKKLAESKAAQPGVAPTPVAAKPATGGSMERIAESFFSPDLLFRVANIIQEGVVTPEEFAGHALEAGWVKDGFIDYLFEYWDDKGDPAVELDKIYRMIGMDVHREIYDAFNTEFVLDWVDRMAREVVRLNTIEEETNDEEATEGVDDAGTVEDTETVDSGESTEPEEAVAVERTSAPEHVEE